jgi:hypothetical protein
MKFQNYNEESKKQGIGGGWYELQQGENKFRVLVDPEPFIQHYIKAEKRWANCDNRKCAFCKEGMRKDSKVVLYVLDRRDETIKIAKLPWSLYTGLGELAASTDWGFKDLPAYDVNMNKQGEGLETRYAVRATRNEAPLTPEQKEELASKKPIAEIVDKLKKKNNEFIRPVPGDDIGEPEATVVPDDLPF